MTITMTMKMVITRECDEEKVLTGEGADRRCILEKGGVMRITDEPRCLEQLLISCGSVLT